MFNITTFEVYANHLVYNKFIEHDMPFYRFLIYLNDAMRLNLIFINDTLIKRFFFFLFSMKTNTKTTFWKYHDINFHSDAKKYNKMTTGWVTIFYFCSYFTKALRGLFINHLKTLYDKKFIDSEVEKAIKIFWCYTLWGKKEINIISQNIFLVINDAFILVTLTHVRKIPVGSFHLRSSRYLKWILSNLKLRWSCRGIAKFP